MVYSNMLSLSQARVVQGKLSFGVGIWLVHVVMIAVLAFLFARRMGYLRFRLRR